MLRHTRRQPACHSSPQQANQGLGMARSRHRPNAVRRCKGRSARSFLQRPSQRAAGRQRHVSAAPVAAFPVAAFPVAARLPLLLSQLRRANGMSLGGHRAMPTHHPDPGLSGRIPWSGPCDAPPAGILIATNIRDAPFVTASPIAHRCLAVFRLQNGVCPVPV